MEETIIFVYDTGFCQTEDDDPQKAVLFFHPHWVSDQQRLALCGQLMGAAHFCSSVFSFPRVLTLQCGKFLLKKFGRYVLSVGSDQTLQEWILQQRFNLLEELVQFFHNSFDTILNSTDCDQETFSQRLTEVLEVYIPVLQYIVCALNNVNVVKSPKKNTSAFLEALLLLEACSSIKGVLGGMVLQNSRVIATQLDPDITKLLAVTDRFHVRAHAEHIKTPFSLPVGVQFIKVFLNQSAYERLRNAVKLKSSLFKDAETEYFKKVVKKKKEVNKIFTVHEEEDCEAEPTFDEAKERLRPRRRSKPKLETDLKERSKSFVGGLNLKVCSTPTVEKTLIHEELVSICSSAKIEQKPKPSAKVIPDIVQDAIDAKIQARSKCFRNPLYGMSMDDLMIDFTHEAYPVPLRYYNFGFPQICREIDEEDDDDEDEDDDDDDDDYYDENEKKLCRKRFYKTIADPMHPVFRYDGVPMSKSLYNSYLDEHYKDLMAANLAIDSREEFLKGKYLEKESLSTEAGETDADSKTSDKEYGVDETPTVEEMPIVEESLTVEESPVEELKEFTKTNQKALRRSLSLPLKPLLWNTEENEKQESMKTKMLHSKTPTTPLTTKLSLLTFEEQIYVKQPITPSEAPQLKTLLKTIPSMNTAEDDSQKGETVACGLFVCVDQDMTIFLILDREVDENPGLILTLWEISTESLKKVENLRNKIMASLSNTSNLSYSFLSMDGRGATVQRSGPWNSEELKLAGSLYYDLVKVPKITEIIIRNEDSVVYGYSSGGNKIFYQQGSCSSAGLPTPADLMGVVTLKARRRLERDGHIVLL